jgi:hypothetical protein
VLGGHQPYIVRILFGEVSLSGFVHLLFALECYVYFYLFFFFFSQIQWPHVLVASALASLSPQKEEEKKCLTVERG